VLDTMQLYNYLKVMHDENYVTFLL